MNRQFIRIAGGLPSKVITLGSNLQDKPKKLILVIPGNPGPASFYEDFIDKLYEDIHEKCPIWSISHLGHDLPKEPQLRSLFPKFQDNEKLLNLDGQIEQKIRFVEEYIPKDCDLTLVGHSIGCKMALETMRHFKKTQPQRKIQAYMLFPTIERMAETPSGRAMAPFMGTLRPLMIFFVFLIQHLVPSFVMRKLVKWHLYGNSKSNPICVDAAMSLIDSEVVNNSLSLAHHELQVVKEINYDELEEVLENLRFYFGTIDNWCPLRFYEDMKAKLGSKLKAEVCQRQFEHAFVISSSRCMAEIVAKWFHEEK